MLLTHHASVLLMKILSWQAGEDYGARYVCALVWRGADNPVDANSCSLRFHLSAAAENNAKRLCFAAVTSSEIHVLCHGAVVVANAVGRARKSPPLLYQSTAADEGSYRPVAFWRPVPSSRSVVHSAGASSPSAKLPSSFSRNLLSFAWQEPLLPRSVY